jgi:uncharacterized protein (TIGR02996 family)
MLDFFKPCRQRWFHCWYVKKDQRLCLQCGRRDIVIGHYSLDSDLGDIPQWREFSDPLSFGEADEFIEHIRTNLNDIAPKLVFADWLEEHNEFEIARQIRKYYRKGE